MPNIAILIDAENVDPVFASQIFNYAQDQGVLVKKEIYGAGIALNEWSDPILQYAIHMNMTLRPSRFKNSSDIALVMGAMDLLAQRTVAAATGEKQADTVDAVIIASSDSDFSALAVRLRSAGIDVIGMGNPEKTNPMWPKACSEFVPLHAVAALPEPRPEPKAVPAPAPAPRRAAPKAEPEKTSKKEQKREKPPRFNPTHSGRIAVIKRFIADHLAAHQGRVQPAALFAALADLQDYKIDQQRSKRKPLDYLARQFGDAFKVEEDESGVSWVTQVTAAPEKAEAPEDAPAQETQEAPREEEAPEAPAPAPAEPAREEAVRQPEPEPQPEPAPAASEPDHLALFMNAGVEEAAARQIISICQGSANKRVVYNKLRKAFGDEDGRRYYQLIKDLAKEQA